MIDSFIKQLLKIILVVTVFVTAANSQATEVRIDFKKFYDDYDVDGSFILYNQLDNKYIFYNQAQTTEQYTPASTFKICNSLIGLETGVIKGENFVIPWDGVERQISAWNQDQNLKSAFKNSTVWYYQEVARQIGAERMKYWLEKVNYGNADTSGGIDKFWLTGGLRITPVQQIDFIAKLYNCELPFSQRAMDIVKNIMVVNDTLGYIVRAKTGWGIQNDTNIGWYVGYVEKNNEAYFFANCVQSKNGNKDFVKARTDIAYQILTELDILQARKKK